MSLDYSKGSSIFNNKLRAGEKLENLPPEEQNKIRALDSALNKMITFENIKVYRYEKILFLERLCSKAMLYEKIYSNTRFLQGAEAYLDKCLIGNVYEDFGFMSTTMIRHAVFIHRPIELIIKVPKYSDGLFIARNGFSFFIQEYEILFPRNRKLKVKSYEISQDRKKITIETLMEGPLWLINGELVRPEE